VSIFYGRLRFDIRIIINSDGTTEGWEKHDQYLLRVFELVALSDGDVPTTGLEVVCKMSRSRRVCGKIIPRL